MGTAFVTTRGPFLPVHNADHWTDNRFYEGRRSRADASSNAATGDNYGARSEGRATKSARQGQGIRWSRRAEVIEEPRAELGRGVGIFVSRPRLADFITSRTDLRVTDKRTTASYAFHDVRAALRQLESRSITCKLILRPKRPHAGAASDIDRDRIRITDPWPVLRTPVL